MAILKSIHIQGFKSIRDARVELGRVNVLIGANASGKLNLVAFFRMLRAIVEEKFQEFVARSGGSNTLIRFGLKATKYAALAVRFRADTGAEYQFRCTLETAVDARLLLGVHEFIDLQVAKQAPPFFQQNNPNVFGPESLIGEMAGELNWPRPAREALDSLFGIRCYQFHDTSNSSPMRIGGYVGDNQRLNIDGSNLAAVLHKFAKVKPAFYRRILATIRQVFPQFGDFVLEPDALAPTQIRLNWRERGQDNLFGPHQLSDGTLRFIALATLLLQPEEELPKVIVIDEPELGLHPNAITVLAALIHEASHHSQLVVATQSVTLLDQFDPEEVIVVERDRVHNATEFRRLDAPSLAGWLENYTLGDLWRKNVIGGGPH